MNRKCGCVSHPRVLKLHPMLKGEREMHLLCSTTKQKEKQNKKKNKKKGGECKEKSTIKQTRINLKKAK